MQKANIQCSDPQVHCLEECSKAKVGEICQYTSAVFRTKTSVNQLSIYGTVADLCEECDSTHTFLTDDPAQPEEDLLHRFQERIEKLSQQDGVSKFCTDAGFFTTVEVGQYFMTKDTEEFSQFTDSVACREYNFPRDEKFSDPKGWIRGTLRLDPYWKLQLVAYKVNMEWKSELSPRTRTILSRGVRISHGLNNLVTDLIDKEQETSEMEFEDYALKSNACAFASRSKAKAKPQRRTSASSPTKTGGKNLDQH